MEKQILPSTVLGCGDDRVYIVQSDTDDIPILIRELQKIVDRSKEFF